ncbi:MAG: MoaD/ThiS family protein [Novosphingobium sp.]
MARVIVTAPLNGEFPGGARELELAAGSVFALVDGLDTLSPGVAEFIAANVSIAVDGTLISDWSTALTAESEVMLVPHIAGG